MTLKHFHTLIICLIIKAISPNVNAQYLAPSGMTESFTGNYTIKGDRFAIWNGKEYIPIFVKGINMGISVPGTQPGNLAASREDYGRWFHLIKEAGYNAVRLYTLHFPRFYEELSQFNLDHPGNPLLLLQGVWLEEQEVYTDLYNLSAEFDKEIREVVSAIHGDINIDTRFGKAHGSFATDISPWVLGFLIGREIFPDEVALTNQAHTGENEYLGTYFGLSGGGDPVEVWITQRLDSLMIFENEQYGIVRPTGLSTWPTLDPLVHLTEHSLIDSQEDDEKMDLSNLVSSEPSGGFFIGYHAYPYYPDFIVQDPNYGVESDSIGPNSYLGYLKDLKKHYEGIPLVIAEFGVPSSWGSGHLTPSGMNHGGITEEQQGQYTIRMLDNILGSGCAGGIQFSLIDEWFKQTWITNPYSDQEYRHFWHNITAPEQNFGILSFAPPPEPFKKSGSFPDESVSEIRLASDYTFFRVRLYLDSESHLEDTLWVAFDTYAGDLGESMLPNGVSIGDGGDTLRAEFALSIPIGGERADLYVIPSYDIYGIKELVRIDTVVSTRSDAGIWNRVRWKTNYFYDFTQYIGKLNISSSDDPYQFNNAVTVFNDSLEIRIPWTLLNFPAPTVRRAMHYVSYHDGNNIVMVQEDTLTSGIAVTVAGDHGLYKSDRYSWSFWDYEKIQNDPPIERKKQSFHFLKRELPQFNSPPIGLADSFEVFPGETLDIGMEEGLLSNDFDIDGNEISAALSFGNSPGHGTLNLHPNGSFNYFPLEGFQGDDFFSYYLEDGFTNSTLISVNIRVGYPLGGDLVRAGDHKNRFTIYPNPGKYQFYIKTSLPFGDAALVVSDMMGREIAHKSLRNATTSISVGDIEPGIYLFKVIFDRQTEVHRVVIQ